MPDMHRPDTLIVNAKVTTLDRANPQAQAVAIRDGRFLAVGSEAEVRRRRARAPRDRRRRPPPDPRPDRQPHAHHPRWPELQHGTALGRRAHAGRCHGDAESQVDRTPAPQWVRVVGGFTEHQFAEKRLPTLAELNAVAPDTPVFILHLYDRALLNAAALRVVGYTKDTPNPPGGEIVRDAAGNPTGLLLAQPNATILYSTWPRAEAARGLPDQFHPPFHARGQQPGRDRGDRRGWRFPELSR
jgi:hypothetical protein